MVLSLRSKRCANHVMVCFGSSELSGTSYLIQVIPNLGRRTLSHGRKQHKRVLPSPASQSQLPVYPSDYLRLRSVYVLEYTWDTKKEPIELQTTLRTSCFLRTRTSVKGHCPMNCVHCSIENLFCPLVVIGPRGWLQPVKSASSSENSVLSLDGRKNRNIRDPTNADCDCKK